MSTRDIQVIDSPQRTYSTKVLVREKIKTGSVYEDSLPRLYERRRQQLPADCVGADMATSIDDYWKLRLYFQLEDAAEVTRRVQAWLAE